MRRLLVMLVVLAYCLAPKSALASAMPDDGRGEVAVTTTIDNSFLDTDRDLSECLNNSVQLPGCGREPTSAGHRGGPLQLATFALMGLGLVFVGWRVTRAILARDAALGSRPS